MDRCIWFLFAELAHYFPGDLHTSLLVSMYWPKMSQVPALAIYCNSKLFQIDIRLLFPIKLNSGIILVIAMFSLQKDTSYYNCAVPLSWKKKNGFHLLLSESKYRNIPKIAHIKLNMDTKPFILYHSKMKYQYFLFTWLDNITTWSKYLRKHHWNKLRLITTCVR